MTSDSCQQTIRELAYQKWEQAGCPAGDGSNFWLEAEQELITCGQSDSACATDCSDESLKISDPGVTTFKKAG